MSVKKLTSFTSHVTAEGTRLSATYSQISDAGVLEKSNERFNVIVVDSTIQADIDAITEFLTAKIPE